MFNNLNEYIYKYGSKGPAQEQYEGDSDVYLCITEVERNPTLLNNKEISDAIVDAVKRTPQYRYAKWKEAKEILFNKLTMFERFILKVEPRYKILKTYFKYYLDSFKYSFSSLITSVTNPSKAIGGFDIESGAAYRTRIIAYLTSFLFIKARYHAYDIPKENPYSTKISEDIELKTGEPTITVDASIENHATGKIADEVFGEKVGLMEGCKIKSYSVIPGKTISVPKIDPPPPSGGFMLEGAMPEEISFFDENKRK